MIAPIRRNPRRKSAPAWHEGFLKMLPTIRRCALQAFSILKPEARQEAVQDVVCNALIAYYRLFKKNKLDLAYPTVLARFGIAQYWDGRRVGTTLNIHDVGSAYCQARTGVVVQRLDHYDEEEQAWREIPIEDKHASPAELAAARIDFPAWLATLSKRDRRIALKLAEGEQTSRVARLFRVSAGRISQIRQELKESWYRFIGEVPPATAC